MDRGFFKPLLDKTLAILLVVLFSPLVLLTSFLILIKMGKPLFFKQIRPGKDEKSFFIYKFRTMTNEKDSQGNLLSDEARLKGFGKLIRSLSLDELPQLWSILKGDMSFVGPRPALFNQDDLIALRTEKGVEKLLPGLTGWAQVNGRDELPISQKVELDVEYLQRHSFLFDLKILWVTFLKVVKRQDVSH